MKNFAAGFLASYLLGALPFGMILVRLEKPLFSVLFGSLTWPVHLLRVADAVYVMQPADIVVRRR